MKNFFNSLMASVKELWSNPIAKTAIVGALGATGGMYAGGVWIINEYTVMHSIIGALTAVAALIVPNPKLPSASPNNIQMIPYPNKEIVIDPSVVVAQPSPEQPPVAVQSDAAKDRLAALLKKKEQG